MFSIALGLLFISVARCAVLGFCFIVLRVCFKNFAVYNGGVCEKSVTFVVGN